MTPFIIPAPKQSDFGEARVVGSPVGDKLPQARFAFVTSDQHEGIATGIWQCSEGQFLREVAQAEFSYFIKGKGSFTPEGGETVYFKKGESIYFAANTKGIWSIEEAVTKTYIIFPKQ